MPENPPSEVSPQTVETALAEAQSAAKGRSWVIPVVTAAILAALFCGYYFVYVGSRRVYLANRNFRALALLGDQLQTLVSIHSSILEFYSGLWDPNRPRVHESRDNARIDEFMANRPHNIETQTDYLKFLAPGFQLARVVKKSADPSGLQVQRRDGRWELVLTLRKQINGADYVGSLELDDLLNPLAASLPFDDILLVSDKGTIVYQQKKAGPQFTTLTSLLQAQTVQPQSKPGDGSPGVADVKPTGREPPVEQNSDPAWRRHSVHLTDVMLAGTGYKLFLQPVVIDSLGESAHEWVLCGLRSSSTLEWEALSISYGSIIWFTAVFFAVCMSGPALKIVFMNSRERLRLRELAFLGLFLVLLGGVFTLAALHAIQFPRRDDTEVELRQLGDNLAQHIYHELRDMRDQLKAWCASPELALDLKEAEHREVVRTPASRGRSGPTPPTEIYPYLGNVFWTDNDGHQIVKWSTSGYVTPLIDVSGLAIFTHPKRIYLDGQGPPFYFGSVLPPNKFEYLGAMTMTTYDCNPALRKSGILDDVTGGAAFLTAQPFSLIDPILPFGYGFALIDRSGQVLFHIDKTRNERENFRLETDWNQRLYAATFGHATQLSLPLKYLGKDYQARVVPIPGLSEAPWSLVVYRDLTGVRTLKLQSLTMSSTLLVLILAGPVLIVGLWCAIRRPRFVPDALWPSRRRMNTYIALICIYGALIVLFLFFGLGGSSEQSVRVGAALPYAALLLTILCFREFPPAPGPRTGKARRFPGATVASLGGLVLLAAAISDGVRWTALVSLLACGVIATAPLMAKPRHYLLDRWKQWRPVHVHAPRYADGPEPKWLNSTNAYVGSALLLLMLLGVLLPMALFRASAMVERRLAIKEAQLHLASALARHRAAMQDQCQTAGESSAAACAEFQNDDGPVWRRIVPDPSASSDGLPKVVPHSEGQSQELYSPVFRRVIYLLHHDYNDAAAEMLGVIADRAKPIAGDGFSDWSWQEDRSRITLTWHGLRSWDPSQMAEEDLQITSTIPGAVWSGGFIGTGVAAGVILIIGGLFWALARKVFLFQVAPLQITGARQVGESLRQGRNVLILLPPVSDWQLEMPKTTLDLRHVASGPKWAETLDLDTLPLNSLIEIRPFEYGENDPEIENQKFILLDKLAHRENTQVAAVMTVPASPKDYRRMFPALDVIDLRDEPFYWLKQYGGAARDLIWKECGPLAALWPIGAQLAADIKDEPIDSEDTIASEILERADGYYRLIWNECSKDQKFVLAQLAADGALNPTNGRAIRQLMRRGLIVKDPQFRIMNESFRRFLRSATTPELKQEWLHESRRSGWGKLHGAFFITITLLGVFLLTTQNALWQSSAAYVTTALGALGTVAKLFNTFKGGGTVEKAN